MRYTVITAHTRTVPQQAWIKRRFVWKSSPPTWRISPFVFIPIFFSYLLLVKMLPLRSEVGFNPPALHPCGHLSYAVHPPGASRRTVPARINPPLLQKKKGENHTYITVFLLLSSLQTPGCLCVCVTGRHLHTAASLLGDASRLKEEEQMSVCASYYAFGSSPKVEEIIIIIITMSSASRHPLTPHDSIVCIYHTSGMTSVFLLFCF